MIASPCINVCRMDPDSGLCTGCRRTVDEIAAWGTADDAGRRRILAAIGERRRLAAPEAARPSPPSPLNLMEMPEEDLYPCVGICMADPDSGYCLGCGRPPLAVPGIVSEPAPAAPQPAGRDDDPDTPT